MGNEIANRGEILLYSDESGKEFISVVFKDELNVVFLKNTGAGAYARRFLHLDTLEDSHGTCFPD